MKRDGLRRVSIGVAVLALSAAFAAGPRGVAAQPSAGHDRLDRRDRDRSDDGLEAAETPWREVAPEMPPFPDPDSLVPVELDETDARYEHLVDVRDVAVGADGVVRYVIAVRTASGALNVFYEGVRCRDPAFRTYAFGTRQGTFRPVGRSAWKPLRRSPRRGVMGYRRELAERYLCHPDGGPRDPDDLRRLLLGKAPVVPGAYRRMEEE